MVKTEMYPIARLLPVEELDRRIRSLEKDVRVLKRLYFVRYRYDGLSVEEAAGKVGVTKMVGYEWQTRWNKMGVEGLVPRFAGGRPSKLDEGRKKVLKALLKERDDWMTGEVRDLIVDEFGVEYTLKQVRVILKGFNMKFGKPYQHDHRRPEDAEEVLKKTSIHQFHDLQRRDENADSRSILRIIQKAIIRQRMDRRIPHTTIHKYKKLGT